MKVILLTGIVNLGNKNDIVEVTAGYACNYLIPHKLAVAVNENSLKMRDYSINKTSAETEQFFANLNETAEKIRHLECRFVLKTLAKDKTFGHINAEMIIKKLANDFGIRISKKCFTEQIKLGIGDHDITIRLHPKVSSVLHVNVYGDKEKQQ